MTIKSEVDNLIQTAKNDMDAEIDRHGSRLELIMEKMHQDVLNAFPGTQPPIEPPPINDRVGIGYDANGFTTFAPSPTVLYVSPNGNDANSGDTLATAFATLRKAHSIATNDPTVEEIRIAGHAQFSGKWVASGASAQRPLRLVGIDPTAAIGAFLVDKPRAIDNLAFVNLSFINCRLLQAGSGLLFERCRFEDKTLDGLVIQGGYPLTPATLMWSNLNIRFCVFAHNTRTNGTAQGLFMSAVRDYRIESCVFDGNGWVVDTGRGGSPSASDKTRSHNVYTKMPSDNLNQVHHNIFSRGASHGIQYRTGGTLEDNLFLRNPIACQLGYAEHLDGGKPDYGTASGSISNNVAIGADDISPGDPRGSFAILSHVDGVQVMDNLMALNGTSDTNSDAIWCDRPTLDRITVSGNKAFDWAVNPLKFWNRATNSIETDNQWDLTEADLADVNKVKFHMSDAYIDEFVRTGFTSMQHARDTIAAARLAIEG